MFNYTVKCLSCLNFIRCDDFYEYACGRFLDERVIPDDKTGITAFSDIENDMKNHLRIIVNEPINETDIQPFKNVRLLNQACLDLTAIENLGTEPIMSKILSLGGWPVMFNGVWDDSEWTWQDTMAKLRTHGFSVSYIFSFSVTSDQQNSTNRIGRVSCRFFLKF